MALQPGFLTPSPVLIIKMHLVPIAYFVLSGVLFLLADGSGAHHKNLIFFFCKHVSIELHGVTCKRRQPRKASTSVFTFCFTIVVKV